MPRDYVVQGSARRLVRPVEPDSLQHPRPPDDGVDIDAVGADAPFQLPTVPNGIECLDAGQDQNATPVEVRCAGRDREFVRRELPDAMTEPVRIELGADPGAVVGDTDDERAAPRRVRHAGHFFRQIGRGLLVFPLAGGTAPPTPRRPGSSLSSTRSTSIRLGGSPSDNRRNACSTSMSGSCPSASNVISDPVPDHHPERVTILPNPLYFRAEKKTNTNSRIWFVFFSEREAVCHACGRWGVWKHTNSDHRSTENPAASARQLVDSLTAG